MPLRRGEVRLHGLYSLWRAYKTRAEGWERKEREEERETKTRDGIGHERNPLLPLIFLESYPTTFHLS